MKIKADLHNHLGTLNPRTSFNEVIDIASQRLGLGGILGILGYEIDRYANLAQQKGYERINFGNYFYVPKKQLFVIRGQEIVTIQGHVLALGFREKFIQKNRDLEDSLKQAKDNNSIIIPAHPFFMWGTGSYLQQKKDLLKYIDAIEVYNRIAIFGNKKAKQFYQEIKKQGLDIGAITNSDGHSKKDLGGNYTLLDYAPQNSQNFIEKLRKSIRKHKDYSQDKQNFSFLSFLEHVSKTPFSMIAFKFDML